MDTAQQQWVVLLVRIAVAASVASLLARVAFFERLLLRDERSLAQRTQMALWLAALFGAGVAVRVLAPNYQAVDLGLAGSLLAGLTGGYWTGLFSGVLISTPAMLQREWLAMPMLSAFGLLGGLLRDLAPHPEEVWRFSPVFDLLTGFGLLRKPRDMARGGFQLLFLCSIVLAAIIYESVSALFGGRLLHATAPGSAELRAAGYFAIVLCIALPLKIWHSLRTERQLEAQNRLLVEARLAALTNQINPHFLFNTLNTIASLVRVNPEDARGVIYKLSNILRRLLRKPEPLTTLRAELAFIEDYLAIEMVRFGDKLRFERDVEPAALDHETPSMLLQPVVENSIRHGLAPRLDGGTIRIRASVAGGRLRIVVSDDGVGIEAERLAGLFDEPGIGVANVNARLKVLYGEDYRMTVESRPGEGTQTEFDLPARLQGTSQTAAPSRNGRAVSSPGARADEP